MCGRFNQSITPRDIQRMFGIDSEPVPPRYNVAPTTNVLAIRHAEAGGKRELFLAKWGLIPSWATDDSIALKTINARSETAAEKPAFRDAFTQRRCLIPAAGWYEWQKVDYGKQPMYMHRKDGKPLAFAGLWEHWHSPDADVVSCTILTRAAVPELAEIHDRMPVILPASVWNAWLSPELDAAHGQALLGEATADGIEAYEVGKRVGNVRNDDAELITRVRHQPKPDSRQEDDARDVSSYM